MARRPAPYDLGASAGAQLRGYVEALAMVAASTLIGLLMSHQWGNSAVDLLYLPAVLAAAVFLGLRPALLAALASALAYNFYFTEPVQTFRVHDASDVVTIVILFLVAVVTSHLAASIRKQARRAAAHAARNATIAGLARRLLSCPTEAEIGSVACREIHTLFGCNAVLVTGQLQPIVIARYPEGAPLTPSDIAAAVSALQYGEPAGRGAPRLNPADWLFQPLCSEHQILAAMGLARDDGLPPIGQDELPLFANLLDQVALALQRARLESEMREVDALRERDRLRSALLSSVGHDLRTPLTAIMAAAAELRRSGSGDEVLALAISSEGSKLERYIANLLDMARIEAGAVKIRSEPVDLVDSVSAALKDLKPVLEGHAIDVGLPADLPLVRADPQLLHHCLINLLDNAARHSGAGSPIHVRGSFEDGDVVMRVEDEGPGLGKAGDKVLETFERISGSDRQGGAGLGLAIVKAFADAMGADVTAANRPDGKGAAFTMRFPERLTLTTQSVADAG